MARGSFLDPALADADGLVGVGLGLTTERLLEAYRRGIFPFYDDTTPVLWWSPDPRAVFELDGLHVSRRLARTVRSGKFTPTVDRCFRRVIEGCADRGPGRGCWLLPEMIEAYTRLHELGHAHSLEVWHDGALAGGVYGVAVGGLFAAESMFTRVTDASKVALYHLLQRLRQRGYVLFDVQYLNAHTESLGAVEVPRREYLRRLRRAVALPVTFADPPPP
jgi:leucyl/phenylalanyl-tRNA--protein transferase